jgi:hypothetical protein
MLQESADANLDTDLTFIIQKKRF